ncbi:MAG: CRISPR-associated protein Cas5 [Moorellales bacterium]
MALERVIVFDLTGFMAHFRKYYTNTSALTYGFPPRTVLMGIVAAVVGWERDSYYEILDRGRFGIGIKTPTRRLLQTVNYVRTKKEDLLELRRLGRVPGTQTPLEFLLPAPHCPALRFRVFFNHPDSALLDALAVRLRQGRTYYPLYLGITECPALALWVDEVEGSSWEVIPAGSAVALNTVVNVELVKEVLVGGGGATGRLVRERVPHSFGPGRTLRPPASVIYESDGRPIQVRLGVPAYRFRLGGSVTEEETVAFLEG